MKTFSHKQKSLSSHKRFVDPSATFWKEKSFSARLILSHLQQLTDGYLTLILPDNSKLEFSGQENREHNVVLNVKNWAFFQRILLRGEVGFAESYVKGEWSTPDLVGLIEMLINNKEVLKSSQKPHFIFNWLLTAKNWLLRNTLRQSISNISTHYDLGNNFYQLWLDSSMTYSSALFQGKDITLKEAQMRKYNRILDLLDPKKGEKILDIGCGWGGFAEAAAKRGCAVEGITLSDEQLSYANKRAKKFPVKASFEKKDYRELIGNYNHIASIGMLEHVGMDYWNQYFRKIYELLNPGGRAMIQSIVYTANDYDDYIHSASFTKLYIFPGGFLPTPDCIKKSAIQAGLKVINTFDFGLDYAKTLSLWRDNFLKAVSKIDKLGFDDNFKRLWHYYLCVSEASFLTHQTSVMQIELIKPVCPEDAYL